MNESEELLLNAAKGKFTDNLHVSKGWRLHGSETVQILMCEDCRKSIIANLQTFELSGEALRMLCPEPPPNR